MTPLDDPRPFGTVLQSWMDRHDLRQREVAVFFDVSLSAVQKWLAPGAPTPPAARSHRALMTLHDEGRLEP